MVTAVCYNTDKGSFECLEAFWPIKQRSFVTRGVSSLVQVHLKTYVQVLLKLKEWGKTKPQN